MTEYEIKSDGNQNWRPYTPSERWEAIFKEGQWDSIVATRKYPGRADYWIEIRKVEPPKCTHNNITETATWKRAERPDPYNSTTRVFICEECGATGKSPLDLLIPRS